MKKIPNTQKISNITFNRSVQPFCPLGQDYYTAEIHVDFEVVDSYMDYIEFDKWIQGLGGASLTIEELAEAVFEKMKEFEPGYLRVVIDANSNKHFPVTVEKTSDY